MRLTSGQLSARRSRPAKVEQACSVVPVDHDTLLLAYLSVVSGTIPRHPSVHSELMLHHKRDNVHPEPDSFDVSGSSKVWHRDGILGTR